MTPIDDVSLRATELEMVTHVGTHLEAPIHLFADGASIDEYDADLFIGHAVVHEVDADPLEAVGLDRIRAAGNHLEAGDALLLWTSWDEYAGKDVYETHPYVTPDVAEWIGVPLDGESPVSTTTLPSISTMGTRSAVTSS